MVVGFAGVLVPFFVVALAVVLCSQVMVLGCFSVVLCGFLVRFVCHFLFPVGNLPARSYAPLCEFVVGCSETFTKVPEIQKLGGRDDERIDDQGFNRGLGQNLRHADIGIAALRRHRQKPHLRYLRCVWC